MLKIKEKSQNSHEHILQPELIKKIKKQYKEIQKDFKSLPQQEVHQNKQFIKIITGILILISIISTIGPISENLTESLNKLKDSNSVSHQLLEDIMGTVDDLLGSFDISDQKVERIAPSFIEDESLILMEQPFILPPDIYLYLGENGPQLSPEEYRQLLSLWYPINNSFKFLDDYSDWSVYRITTADDSQQQISHAC